MKQKKYVIKDIANNKLSVLLLVLMNIIVMFIFCFAYEHTKHAKESVEIARQYRGRDGFIVNDYTDDLTFKRVLKDKKSVDRFQEYFSKLEEGNGDYFTQYYYEVGMSKNGNIVRMQYASEKFFSFFGIEVTLGRHFTSEEYAEKLEYIPVLLGYELKEGYKIGDIYTVDEEDSAIPYKIVGILEKNSVYYNVPYFDMPISLDYSYIVPLGKYCYNTTDMAFSDYDMATCRMVYFGEKSELEQYIKELNVLELELENVSEIVDEYVGENIVLIAFVAVIIVIFVLIVMGVTRLCFNRMLKKQLVEYGIHLMCGASIKDMTMRFGLLVAIVQVISIAYVSIFVKSIAMTAIMLLFGAVVHLVVMIYPVNKLKRNNVMNLIKVERE